MAYPIASGVKRSVKRCLAVGSDCSVGKMHTTMAMEREMHAREMKAMFRATHMRGLPDYAPPLLHTPRDIALPLARIANPICVVAGMAINRQHMEEKAARDYLVGVEAEMGLPAAAP